MGLSLLETDTYDGPTRAPAGDVWGDVSNACVAFEFDVMNLLRRNGAGDGDRTRNIQLGKVN